MNRSHFLCLGLLLLAGLLLPSASAQAQSTPPNRAGLIIVQPNQEPLTYCAALDSQAQTTGIQMLEQVGLDFIADYGNSMGASICRIGDTGCAFPSQDCFCQCQGATCIYWSYHRLDPDSTTWVYSQFGAGQAIVPPGAVEAWVWSSGDSGSTQIQPPDLTFADICAGELTAAAAAETDQIDWPMYLGFAALLLALGAASLWRRRPVDS